MFTSTRFIIQRTSVARRIPIMKHHNNNNNVTVNKNVSNVNINNKLNIRNKSTAQITDSQSSNLSSSSSSSASTSSSNNNTTTNESSVPIVLSLIAASAGIITVSLAATIVENITANDIPRFNINDERFNQNTFYGRFSKMLLACDPKLLLYTKKQVYEKLEFIKKYENNNQNNNNNIQNSDNLDHILWESKRIVDSALNDNNEWIPRPFRMSGYVPYNGPICVAMVASQSTISLLFWSWINQSQNALVNYYNRNSSSNLTNDVILKSYSIAVISALSVAFGLSTFIQKKYNQQQAKKLLKYVAFPSSVAASSLNCYIIRSPEIIIGIPLLNENGDIIQIPITNDNNNNITTLDNDDNNNNNTQVDNDNNSQIAAKHGVYLTTLSRAILQAPVFFLPPLLLSYIPLIKNYIIKYPKLCIPLSTYLLLICFGCGLPATVAIFPQISIINSIDVEKRFHNIIDPTTNKPYTKFYYNKGL